MSQYNISASQVKSHSQCPKKWWFRKRSDKEPTKKKSKYINIGQRVHESIEEVLTAESPPPLGHREAVEAAIQEIYREKDEYPIPDDDYEDGLTYCSKASKFISKQAPFELKGVELREEYRIDRDDMATGVTAIMDVVADDEIWDWKTGKIRDETPHEEKIQGSIYMAAYLNKFGEEPSLIRFIYLKEGKVRKLEPNDEIWEYMIERAKALVRAKESGNFPAEPGDMCYWCSYEYWCDASPVGMGGVPWEEY